MLHNRNESLNKLLKMGGNQQFKVNFEIAQDSFRFSAIEKKVYFEGGEDLNRKRFIWYFYNFPM